MNPGTVHVEVGGRGHGGSREAGPSSVPGDVTRPSVCQPSARLQHIHHALPLGSSSQNARPGHPVAPPAVVICLRDVAGNSRSIIEAEGFWLQTLRSPWVNLDEITDSFILW